MQELEKIMREIDKQIEEYMEGDMPLGMQDFCAGMKKAQEVICKHINDGWIPAERKCPPIDQRCLATIKHHEWISDYDSDWVSDKDKMKYPEYTEVCEIAYNGKWNYMSKDYEISEVCIKLEKNIAKAIDEIIAWKPLPEPYNPEK